LQASQDGSLLELPVGINLGFRRGNPLWFCACFNRAETDRSRNDRRGNLTEMDGDNEPRMTTFGVTPELIQRVDLEMERRAEFERKIASVQRRDSLSRDSANIDDKSVDGCSAVGLVALCGFLGASLGGGCVGVPLMLIVGDDLPMNVVMTITGVVGATLATLNLRKQRARVASPQTRSQVQPDISAGALATDAEIEQASRYQTAFARWKSALWSRWDAMSGDEFEQEFASLLNRVGWKVRTTKRSNDGGIDIHGEDASGNRVSIQCKWWIAPCGVKPVRELAGVLNIGARNCVGFVVCKGGFTKSAADFAGRAKIVLWQADHVRWILANPKSPPKAKDFLA
jgi:hypothetical protein